MRRARRDAPSPKGAARRDLSIDTYNWAFGSSTPRELSYLCAIPPEYRVYNVRLEAIRKMIMPTNQQRVRSRSHQTHLMASARKFNCATNYLCNMHPSQVHPLMILSPLKHVVVYHDDQSQ
jgi:hypothetical protein